MLRPEDRVLCAVSGGADSMCLLSWLHDNAQTLGITVAAAHFNHCLRGEESDRDEEFVKDEFRRQTKAWKTYSDVVRTVLGGAGAKCKIDSRTSVLVKGVK